VACDVAAHARLRVPWSGVAAMRRQPPPLPAGAPSVALLKHADEQTVVALAALSEAVRDPRLDGADFSAWGILAGPCYPGRAAVVTALDRFKVEGAWGMSPHLIPHRSLHSLSGTLSHALKTHGPNFGVAGSPGDAAEVLRHAAALLDVGVCGLWVVLTRVFPEAEIDATGNHLVPVHVEAAALALRPSPGSENGSPRLRLTLTGAGSDGADRGPRTADCGLAGLLDLLDRAEREGSAAWRLPDGGRLEAARTEDRR